ncbi:MAG: fused MFS/spermidine synthase [Candidatus Zixiibacteriota bacterium]
MGKRSQLTNDGTKPRFFVSAFYLGFLSLVAQTILLREMLAVFSGNEIVLGAILAFWLLWVGLGSLFGNWFSERFSRSLVSLGWSYPVAAFSLFVALFLVRHCRALWGYLPGETIPLLQTIITATVSPAPLCFLLGFLFVLNASFFSERLGRNLTNKVYLLEAIGATVGGVVVTFVLIPYVSNINIAFLILLTSLIAGLYLFSSQAKRISIAVVSLITIGNLLLLVSGFTSGIDRFSLKSVWRGFSVRENIDSKYGKIIVTQDRDLFGFYENSSLGFYVPNESHAEESIHLALLQLWEPRSLLLIGGGPGDNLNEAVKYKDLKVDYVELDPELVRVAEKHLTFSPEVKERVRFHFLDGRFYVKDAERNYDAVILDLPEPLSAQVNRFYSREFFEEVKGILKPGGVFSFKLPSSENYISPQRAQLLGSLKKTMELLFEQALILPGTSNIFLGTDRSGELLFDPDLLLERLHATQIETKFVNQNFLFDRLSFFRMKMLEDNLAATIPKVNTDLNPICYYYGGLLWASQFRLGGGKILQFLYELPGGWPWFFVLTLGVMIYLLSRIRANHLIATSKLLIFTVGFASMVGEVVILLSYQTFRGYLYSRIGLLLALFMAGLSLGALIGRRYRLQIKGLPKALLLCQVAFVIYISVFIISLSAISSGGISSLIVEMVTFVYMLIAGLLGGIQFVFANNIIMARRPQEVTKVYGTAYGLDLLGSAVGAAFCSAFFVPLLGLRETLGLLLVFALLCISLLVWLVVSRK